MSCVDHREAILGVTAQWRSWITPRVRPCEDHPTPLRYLYMAKHTEELSGMDTVYLPTSSSEYGVHAKPRAGLRFLLLHLGPAL
jgi:hypothetical protein